MTLLTDALRQISSTRDERVHAVDPLSDDERALAERIVARPKRSVDEPAKTVKATVVTGAVESDGDQAVTGTSVDAVDAVQEMSLQDRYRMAIAEAFGTAFVPAPRSQQHVQQRQKPVEPSRPADDRQSDDQEYDTIGLCDVEPSTSDAPASHVCQQILRHINGAAAGHVVAFVFVEEGDERHAAQIQQLLDETARELSAGDPSRALVIKAVGQSASVADVENVIATAIGRTELERAVRSKIRRPAVLADLVAQLRNDSIPFVGRAPFWQSERTLAEIVSFVDACRETRRWTLVGVAASNLADASAFLQRCDAVLVVVEVGQTDRHAARKVVRQLRHHSARVIGGVVLAPAQSARAAA